MPPPPPSGAELLKGALGGGECSFVNEGGMGHNFIALEIGNVDDPEDTHVGGSDDRFPKKSQCDRKNQCKAQFTSKHTGKGGGSIVATACEAPPHPTPPQAPHSQQ